VPTLPVRERGKRDPASKGRAKRAPLLGTSGDSPTTAGQRPFLGATATEARQSKRLSRHAVKVVQRLITASRSSALCWFPSSSTVSVDVGRQLTAQVSGVHRCGSGWSCLLCAPVVRSRRAEEIDQGLNRWLAAGGGALLVTLTCSHGSADALEPRLAAMTSALNSLLKGRAWNRFKVDLGYRGAIRAVEVTYGENGWHPHNHALFVLEQPATEDQRQALWRWIHDRWASILLRRGLGCITEAYGVDVRQVTGDVLGQYLTKVEDGWSTGLELTRGDVKNSKGGLVPFQILGDYAATGDVASRALWIEYEEATFGKRWLRWTPGLRTLLLGCEAEQSDIELAASEGVDLALVRWLVDAQEFASHVREGTTGVLLNDVEAAAGVVILLSDLFGHQLLRSKTGPLLVAGKNRGP